MYRAGRCDHRATAQPGPTCGLWARGPVASESTLPAGCCRRTDCCAVSQFGRYAVSRTCRVALVTNYPVDPARVAGGVQAVSARLVAEIRNTPDLELHVIHCHSDIRESRIVTDGPVTVHYLAQTRQRLIPNMMTGVGTDRGRTAAHRARCGERTRSQLRRRQPPSGLSTDMDDPRRIGAGGDALSRDVQSLELCARRAGTSAGHWLRSKQSRPSVVTWLRPIGSKAGLAASGT